MFLVRTCKTTPISLTVLPVLEASEGGRMMKDVFLLSIGVAFALFLYFAPFAIPEHIALILIGTVLVILTQLTRYGEHAVERPNSRRDSK